MTCEVYVNFFHVESSREVHCPSFLFDAFEPAHPPPSLDIQTKVPFVFEGTDTEDVLDYYVVKSPYQPKPILVESTPSGDILPSELVNYTRKSRYSRKREDIDVFGEEMREEDKKNEPSFVLLPTKNSGPEVLLVSSSFNNSGDLSQLALEESDFMDDSILEEELVVNERPQYQQEQQRQSGVNSTTTTMPLPLHTSVFNLGLNGVFRVPATTVVSVNLMQPSVNYGMLRIVPRLAAADLSG